MISEEDLALYRITQDVDEAVEEITRFYRVYHSSRYVGDQLVLRLNHSLAPEAVAQLNQDFADLVASEPIVQRGAFPAESGEPEISRCPGWPSASTARTSAGCG